MIENVISTVGRNLKRSVELTISQYVREALKEYKGTFPLAYLP